MLDALVTRAKREVVIGGIVQRGKGPSLDIGCGAGRYLPWLPRPVTGVDIDKREVARLAARGWAVRRVDARKLPFRSGSFRTVLLSEVVEHVDAPERLVKEAARVLAPGGMLVVTTPAARYPFIWDPRNWVRERSGHAPVRRKTAFTNWTPDHKKLLTLEELKALVAKEMQVVEVRCAGRTATPILTALWLPVYATWKVAKRLGLGGLRPAYEELFERVLRVACAEDGEREPCLTIIVRGRKKARRR